MLQWLYTPIPNSPFYRTNVAYYPGPYGVFSYEPLPYYSDFRLNSIARMNWTPFQKNWSETMNYAQTKSSFRTYPQIPNPYSIAQFPASRYAYAPPAVRTK